MSQILSSSSLLQVKDLTVRFTRERGFVRTTKSIIEAVSKVSFDINESEILSIVGESGSGKTTVARCVLRLVEPTEGQILYGGVDISSIHGKRLLDYRRNAQIVFQDPYESLNHRESVFTLVSSPLRYLRGEHDSARMHETVSRLLEEVGLNPGKFMNRFPHQLSGGERQRVSIARALASDPKLLVADEPVTMLDAAQRLSVLRLIKELKLKRNLAVLFITHDLASANSLGGRMLVMYKGKMVESGDTNVVVGKPHHPYVELIRESMPVIGRSVAGAYDSKEMTSSEEAPVTRGCIFRPRCRYATAVCEDVEPPMQELTASHYAACHNPLNAKTDG